MKIRNLLAATIVFLLVSPVTVLSENFIPEIPDVEELPVYSGQEWFWISGARLPSAADGQAYLYSEEGKPLGQLSTGYWFKNILNAHKRDEIITVETHFERTVRGRRHDVVAIYDQKTLNLKREIDIPPKRLQALRNDGVVRLSEDERFLLIVNYTPAQSLSVVDLELGTFVEEVETPGCSVIYSAGNRDYYSICGNGSFMHLKFDDTGRLISRSRTEPLFDPVDDFLTISASQIGDTWYFVSRENNVYAIKMDGETIEVTAKWSLVTDDERDDLWGISGLKHTAAHEASGELYVLVHQGEPHEFEQPGTDVWVYDVHAQKKVREIELETPLGSHAIAISQSERPRLYVLEFHVPIPLLFTLWIYLTEGESAITEVMRQRASIYDAASGEHMLFSDMVPVGGFVLNIQAW